ncbi:MAG: hypothetical protein IJM97_06835 [Clostridia bacterium]|nr:hypothetical protein [Clostridia bacterium]MBQ6708644.1 hypothetical protein [Clostridia bacterium]
MTEEKILFFNSLKNSQNNENNDSKIKKQDIKIPSGAFLPTPKTRIKLDPLSSIFNRPRKEKTIMFIPVRESENQNPENKRKIEAALKKHDLPK